MQNQKSQILDALKALLLVDAKHSARLAPVPVKNERMNNERHSSRNHHHTFTHSHKNVMSDTAGKSTSVRHAQNFLVNAVAISICMTALILSMDSLPIIFKVIAFCGSLMVGFIIEIMLNGDEYE